MPEISQYGGPKVGIQVAEGPHASTLPKEAFEKPNLMPAFEAARQIKQRADQAQAEDTMLSFEKQKNQILYDPQSGYFSSQGKAAYDGAHKTNQALNKLVQDHADQIGDPTARQAFVKTATMHVIDAERGIMQHSLNGLKAWETSTTKAQTESALQNAPLYRNDPEHLGVQFELGKQAVIDAAHHEGMTDGDVIAQRVKDYTSTFYSATISAAIHDGSENGIQSLNKYGDNITEPDRIKLKNELEKKQKEEETSFISSTSIAVGRSIADQYYDQGLDKAFAEIDNKYPDPKMNKEIRKEVASNFRMRDYEKQRDQTNAADAAEQFLQASKPGDVRTVNDFKTQYPDQWNKIPPSVQNQLEAGKFTVTNPDTLLKIQSMSMPELADLNTAQVADQLSAPDRKAVQKLVDDARSGKHDIQLQSNSQYLASKVKEYGLNNEEKQQAVAAAQDELNKTIEQSGKPLSDRDQQKILKDSLSAFVIKRGWWRPDTKFTPENTPVPTLHAMNLVSDQIVKRLPNVDRNKLNEQLASVISDMDDSNTPVTPGGLLSAYLLKYPQQKTK